MKKQPHSYKNVPPKKPMEPEPYLTPRVFLEDKAVGTGFGIDEPFILGIENDVASHRHLDKITADSKMSEEPGDKMTRSKFIHFNPQYECTVYNIVETNSCNDPLYSAPYANIQSEPSTPKKTATAHKETRV